MQTKHHFIDIDQLRVGLYIHLDLGWMDHPFTFSNFKLKDEGQIAKVRKIGLKQLRYDPKRSDCEPLPLNETLNSRSVISKAQASAEIALRQDSEKIYTDRLKKLHEAMEESERKFILASDISKKAIANIEDNPQASIHQAKQMLDDMVHTTLTEPDIAMHAINGSNSDDKHHLHPLNVTVLSLMLSKSMSMTAEDTHTLALAALFHDTAKANYPDIPLEASHLTPVALRFTEQHTVHSAEIAKKSGLSEHIEKVILQHNEFIDGSGYPSKLKDGTIDPLARIVSVVNVYDSLCNPADHAHAMTPYEALKFMFSNMKSKFDEGILKQFIKCLGVYPPGSVVQLSSGMHGIVVSVNPGKPLKPFVMVHEPIAKREKPLVLDLRTEATLTIGACIRPHQLPPEALIYLNPRRHVSYFLDTDLAKDK
ncbi:MAG: HD-GYP domain-containing protein [Methylophilaceae bacterium]